MSENPKKYDEWITHQMVNLLEAVLTHNSTKLEQSLSNIEHGLNFTEEMSSNLVDIAIKFRTLLRIYRTQKPLEVQSSPWAWLINKPGSSSSAAAFDLSELKSAIDYREQKKKEDVLRKQEVSKERMTGSIKDLRTDEDEN